MSLFREIRSFCGTEFSDKPIGIKPWGGSGGGYWSFNEEGDVSIKQIEIWHGVVIHSITFRGELADGTKAHAKFGGPRGEFTAKIDLNPGEYLTHISGRAGLYVVSLEFRTNVRVYGPFGGNGGNPFTLPVKGGAIIGFHGRSGDYIDAIGVYMKKGGSARKRPMREGPWGGEGGDAWSFNQDGLAILKSITIDAGEVVYNISFDFEINGAQHTQRFGSRDGGSKRKIELNWPEEYVIGINGYMKADSYLGGGNMHLKSLNFVTNRKSYGPFGYETGSYFTSPTNDLREIVGFYGRSGDVIDAIGIYRDVA